MLDILFRVHLRATPELASLVQRERRIVLKRRWMGEAHWLSPECILLCSLRSVAGVAFADSVPLYNEHRRECESSPERGTLSEVTVALVEAAWEQCWLPAWKRLQGERQTELAARVERPKSHIFANWYVVFIPQRAFSKLSMERQLAIVIRRGGSGRVLSSQTKPTLLGREELAGLILSVVCDDEALARRLVSHPSRSGKFAVYRADWVPASDTYGRRLSARAYAHSETVTPEERPSVFEAERVRNVLAYRAQGSHSKELRKQQRAGVIASHSVGTTSTVRKELLFSSPSQDGILHAKKRPRVDTAKFFCQKVQNGEPGLSEEELPNNSLICKALSELATHWDIYCKKVPTAQFKVRGYRAAMNYVKALAYDLTTVDEVRQLVANPSARSIGKGLGERLEEILRLGYLREARGLEDSPTFKAIRELTGVWGGESRLVPVAFM